MSEKIFLDHTAYSHASKNAICAMMPFFERACRVDKELYSDIDAAHKRIKELFGADGDAQFIFTSSGAEADAIALHSAYHMRTKHEGRNHFVGTSQFAPSVINYEDDGVCVKLAELSTNGFVTKEALIEAISPRTAMVSLAWASGRTGVMQPLEEIAQVCQERAIWLHVDATHVVGKLSINFSELPIDILTFSGHAIQAPQGTGGLFAKKMIPLRPCVFDPPFTLPLFIGLGEAAFLAKDTESLYCSEVCRLRDMFERGVVAGKVVHGDEARVCHISAIHFAGINPELLAFSLARKGLFVDWSPHADFLTFSLTKDTQEHELERALLIINETVKRLKKVSL